MLFTLAVILLIAWSLGVVGADTIGAFVHVLLVLAVVLFVVGWSADVARWRKHAARGRLIRNVTRPLVQKKLAELHLDGETHFFLRSRRSAAHPFYSVRKHADRSSPRFAHPAVGDSPIRL